MVNFFTLVTGYPGASGYGSATTAEQVTEGIDASNLTAIVTDFIARNPKGLGYESCQVVVIGGGASGIGLETARVLALRNAHVIIAARNMNAANEAKEMILKDNKSARIDVLKLDLSSLTSVRECANKFIALNLPLNILINNAGIMFCPFQLSEDGVELQFATNHLGHFLFTNLLLDKIKQTAKATGIEGRIVNLSSIAHLHTYPGGIRFDKINDEDGYSDKRAYGQSKLANVLHANELSRRLKAEGANITVNSLHPGLIMTNLMRHSYFLMRFLNLLTGLLLWKNVPQGASTTCYVALHPQLKGETGKYYVDCNELEPYALAKDEELAKKLWEFSENLVNSATKLKQIN